MLIKRRLCATVASRRIGKPIGIMLRVEIEIPTIFYPRDVTWPVMGAGNTFALSLLFSQLLVGQFVGYYCTTMGHHIG